MCKTKPGAELSSSSLCWGWSWDQVGLDSLLVAVTLCYKSALNNRCCIILVGGAEGGFQVLVSTKTFDQGRLRRGCILGRPFIMKKYFDGLEDKSERNGKEKKNHFFICLLGRAGREIGRLEVKKILLSLCLLFPTRSVSPSQSLTHTCNNRDSGSSFVVFLGYILFCKERAKSMGKQKKSGYIHFWSVRAREEGTKTNKQPVTHSFVSTQLSSTRGILQHHKRVIKLVELHASVCVWETLLFRCCRVRRPGGSVVAGGCFNVGFFGGVSFSLTVPTRYGMSLVFFFFLVLLCGRL